MEAAQVSEEIKAATSLLDNIDLERSSSVSEAGSTSENPEKDREATSPLHNPDQEESSSVTEAASTADNSERNEEANSPLRNLDQEESSSVTEAASTADNPEKDKEANSPLRPPDQEESSSVTEAASPADNSEKDNEANLPLRNLDQEERSSVTSASDDHNILEDTNQSSSVTSASGDLNIPEDTNQRSSEVTSEVRSLNRKERSSDADATSKPVELWNALPSEVQDLILAFVPFYDLIQLRAICRSFRDVRFRKNFQQARVRLYRREFHLSPLVFYVQDGLWYILALDYKAKVWRRLPPFPPPIPAPDTDLFKDFLVASHGGLFVVNVGKPSEPEKLYVSNLLIGSTQELPPLEHSRHPVVLHVRVTLAKNEDVIMSSYLIIAVGSSASGTESLSRKTEVYDSVKGKWAPAGDVPGSDFSLNDHQTGVYSERENLLLCVGFMVNGLKGILAFDIGKGEWREDWICPLFVAEETSLSVHFAIAQLVECNGIIYLFSEQESGRFVTHCIDRLDLVSGSPGFVWTRKVTRQRQGYRALLVYPEYTCLPVGENKLCIFNTIERSGVVYDMSEETINPERFENLPACPPMDDGVVFHSLNPVAYAFEPSFGASV